MPNVVDMNTTEVAILLDDHVDKYHPGIQTFRLQTIAGLNTNTRAVYSTQSRIPNLMNKDTSALQFNPVNTGSVVKIKLPREITRNFEKKFIPVGTRFIVSFNSGDITKPVIVGREFD